MSRSSLFLLLVSVLLLAGGSFANVNDASWPSDSHSPALNAQPLFPHVLSADDMLLGDSDWSEEADTVKHVMQTTGGSSSSSTGPGSGQSNSGGIALSPANFTISQCQPTAVALSGVQVVDLINSTQGAFTATLSLAPLTATPINGGVLGSLTLQYLDASSITLASGSTGISQTTPIQFTASSLATLNLALASLVYTPAQGLQDSVNQLALLVDVQSQQDTAIQAVQLFPISFAESTYTPIAIYPLEGASFDNLTAAINETFHIPPIAVSNLANADDELAVHIQVTNGILSFTNDLSGIYVEPSINPLIVNLVGHVADVNRVLANLTFNAICPSGPSCSSISDAGFTITVRDFANNTECPVVAVTDCILNINSNNNSIIEAAVFPPTVTVITLADGTTAYNVSWLPLSATTWQPSQQQGEVTAYSVAITSDPLHSDYAQVSKALEYWHVLTNLTADTNYWVEVQVWSAAGLSTCPEFVIGGRSVCAPYPAQFHTGVNAPALTAVSINSVTSNSITFTTTPGSADVNSVVATVRLSNGTLVGSSPYIIIPVTVAGGAVVYVAQGLTPFTSYIITVAASNPGGMGPSSSVSAWTKLAGPQIIGFVASDPTNANTVQSVGDVVTVTFDQATNQPALANPAQLQAMFSFQPVPLAASYSAVWKSASELLLTVTSVSSSAVPAVGVESISVVGALTSADGVSDKSTSTATLTGNWGMHGLGSYFVLPAAAITLEENAQTYLGVNTSFTADMLADASRTYTLSVQVLEPILAGASLNGSSAAWSTGGILITTTGTASQLQYIIGSVVLTSPRNYFGDVSLQYQLLSGTTLIGEAVQLFHVVHVNHVPVINAPASVSVPLQQTTAVPSISVSDVDVAVGSLIDEMTVTLSASAGGKLSFTGSANAGVVYAPSFAVPSAVYQLSGPLLAVNAALKSLQFTFDYTTVAYGVPAQYFVLVSANDHGNGGQPNLLNAQRVNVAIDCPATVSALTATAIQSATLSASGNELVVLLQPALSDSVLAQPFVACSSVFDAASVKSFGAGAVCHYTSTASIVVELGTAATVSYHSSVGVVRNAFARCGAAAVPSAAASVSVAFDLTQQLAAVAISGPSTGSLCEDLTLTAVAFPASAHALHYSWQLPSYIATSPLVESLSLSGPSLTVPVAAFLELTDLPPSFTFTLSVTDFLGRVQSDSYAVSFDSAAKPLLLPLTPTTVRQHSEDALDLSLLASMPSCAKSVFTAPPTYQIVYQWSVTPALPGVSLGTASSLHLPAHALSYTANSQHVYTFTVEASLSTNPQLAAKQEFSVVLLPSSLQPRIAGGVTRSVAAASAMSVDASSSFDPIATSTTASSEYTFVWSCQAAAPQGACYGADGSVLPLPSTSALSFAAGALPANAYTFTVQYAHARSGRSAVSSQTVIVLDPFSSAVELSLNTAQLTINAGDKFAVSAFSPSTTQLAVNWTVLGNGAAHLPLSTNSAVQSTGSLSSLVLNAAQNASFFEAGATYQITATAVTAINESSYASTVVYVNIPPTCSGDLSLSVVGSSSSVTALSTAFTMAINATACVDADAAQTDAVLFQFFRLDAATGLYHWLTSASPVAATSEFVLPSGSSVVVGVRVSDRLGGHTDYSTTVAVAASSSVPSVAAFLSANTSDAQLASNYGDAVSVVSTISAVLSTAAQSSLPAAELSALKDSLLMDLLLWSASLPDDSVTTVLADLVADASSTSVYAANHTLAFVAAISGGDAMSASVNELRSVVAILNGITALIVNGQGSSTGGPNRRLLSGSLDAATLNTLNGELFAALNSLSVDISTHMLSVEGDSLPVAAAQLSGELQRGVVGNDSLSVSVAGSTLTVPSVAVAPASALGSVYDVALFVTPSAAFDYVAMAGQVSEVFFVGAYSAAAYSSPLAPHTVASTLLTSLPAGSTNQSATLDLAYSAALAGSCLNQVDSVTKLVCSLECRQWNGTSFSKQGVSTDFLALSNATHTARCVLSQPGVYALFKSDEAGLVLPSSSTGAASTGNGLPVDQSNAVRASVSFPSPFSVSNMRDFKLGLVQDLAALSGEPTARFNIEQVTANTLTGATSVILDIWVPVADNEATSQDVYVQLAGLVTSAVLSTSYLRYADLSSWLEQCSDLVFRPVCDASSDSSSDSWMLPLIISASAAGFLLLCALTVLAARRYWSAPSAKDDKTLEDFTLPSATAGAAKQYIYSPPTAGADMDAEVSRADEEVSDVVLVGGNAGIDPHTAASVGAGLGEEEISEPVIVESEAEAAELAKQSELRVSSQHSAESLYDDEEKELSVNSASASGQSRHFYYVDESVARSELSSNSAASSANSRSEQPSQSARPSRQSVSASKTPSHFRVGGTNAASAVEPSVSGSLSTRSASHSASRSSGPGGMHFRYSDNEDAQSTSRTPALPSLSHSPSHSAATNQAEGFHSFSQLDLQAGEQPTAAASAQPSEKKAVRVVRPGQQ